MDKMEKLFAALNDKAEHFVTTQQVSYLEGVLDALDTALAGDYTLPTADATKDDVRKAIQIAVLKGMRKAAQPNHQMTPDTLGFLVGYFVEQFYQESDKVTLLDPALGTGNLVFTIMNMVDKVEATGIEVDELLIHLASATAELLAQPITLYRQDALEKLLVAPVDAVVCDLPVGYYPNEEVALDYELCAAEGMSYAHHLFIEQSMNYVKEGGYAFFLIPATLFESEQAAQLHKYIKSHAWIQAVIQLPDGMFTSRAHEKSLLILQKQHAEMRAPKEVLLAKVPSLQNKNALGLFFEKVKIWQEQK